MKRLLLICLAMLLLVGCKEKRYFTGVTGEIQLVRIGFEDKSFRDFTVVSDVLYAGSDTSSRYKLIFYLPDGWDDSYPILLDRHPGHPFGRTLPQGARRRPSGRQQEYPYGGLFRF